MGKCLLSACVAALLLSSCGVDSALGTTCDTADDCGTGRSCSFGRCRLACVDDVACEAAESRCVFDEAGSRGCLLPARGETRCLSSVDCPEPLVCVAGACRNSCAEAGSTCPDGATCVDESGAQLCVWSALPPMDGGVDAGADGPGGPIPFDASGAGGDGDMAGPSWPEDFPAACIPADGAPIGSGCTTNDDCAEGVCDVERLVPLEVSTPGGGTTTLEAVHSPGGTCVVAVPDPRVFDPFFLISGGCGLCARYTFNDYGEQVCLDRCDPDAPLPRGGCREGYRCSFSAAVCVPGCRSDDECRLAGLGGEALTLIDEAPTCDLATGLCTQPTGSGGLGSACDWHDDCQEGFFCGDPPAVPIVDADGRATRLVEVFSRGGCGGASCPGYEGRCTRLCDESADCGETGACPGDEFLPEGLSNACLIGCTVGAEPPEDQLGAGGRGEGCPPGFACFSFEDGRGACNFGTYNDVTEPNVGELACGLGFFDGPCWSPFGRGFCDANRLQGLQAVCSVDCSDPLLASQVCPDDVGACLEGACRGLCETAADCPLLVDGCVDVGEGRRACAEFCESDGDCRDGESCRSIDPDTGRGACDAPFDLSPVCGGVLASVLRAGGSGENVDVDVLAGAARPQHRGEDAAADRRKV
ncbi:MAG: hypothetical protein AAF447_12470, partial [Myxococcota bacterium]